MPAISRISTVWSAIHAIVFAREDICDEGAVRNLLEQHRIDTHRAFRGRIARRPLDLGSGRFHPHQRRRHAYAAQGGEGAVGRSQARAGAPFPPCLDRRGLWLLEPERPAVPRVEPVRAEFPVFRQQGRLGSSSARLSRDLRTANYRDQLLEQLRALSVSREAHPAHAHQYSAGQAPAGLRRRTSGTRLAACRRPLRGDRRGA